MENLWDDGYESSTSSVGSVSTLDAEVLDAGEAQTSLTFKPEDFPLDFIGLGEFESAFLTSAMIEIKHVYLNSCCTLKESGLNNLKLSHCVYYFLSAVLEPIVQGGKSSFFGETGVALSTNLAFSCVLLHVWIAAYDASTETYFEDEKKRDPLRRYKHPRHFPGEKIFRAFNRVLQRAEVKKKAVGFHDRESKALWERPDFKSIPYLQHQVNETLFGFAELLKKPESDKMTEQVEGIKDFDQNFSEKNPLLVVLDD
jgi:hypothetical protein